MHTSKEDGQLVLKSLDSLIAFREQVLKAIFGVKVLQLVDFLMIGCVKVTG